MFDEIYGTYYNAVAEILEAALSEELDRKKMLKIISKKGFLESNAFIADSLTDGTWPLIDENWITPILSPPAMPLTTLQKRWMKTILEDPRVRLFDLSSEGLEDVRPLYRREDICYFDQLPDGDDYEDEGYISRFRTILQSLREKRILRVSYEGARRRMTRNVLPVKLEYSLKDDKFRLLANSKRGSLYIINLRTIKNIDVLEKNDGRYPDRIRRKKKSLVMTLTDERNALERAMLHFSDLEKTTEKIDEDTYRITLTYFADDEAEILIRILSFGPRIRVTEPESFIRLIRERLERQKKTSG